MELSQIQSVERVIIVPRNGFINRLQAMASSSILAEDIGAELQVCWDIEPVAPAPCESIFGPNPFGTVSKEDVEKLMACGLEDFPRYITHRKIPGLSTVVSIAGHDIGEQPLMDELLIALCEQSPQSLVIFAGGRFSFRDGSHPVTWDSAEFRHRRADWYEKLKLIPRIEGIVDTLMSAPSIGLHLRYSDRSHQAPSRREIARAVSILVESTGISRIFVASDSLDERTIWLEKLHSMGLDPWHSSSELLAGIPYANSVAALLDWRILSKSAACVFFNESSYGYEAAVATGRIDSSLGLKPNALVSAKAHLNSLKSNLLRRLHTG